MQLSNKISHELDFPAIWYVQSAQSMLVLKRFVTEQQIFIFLIYFDLLSLQISKLIERIIQIIGTYSDEKMY